MLAAAVSRMQPLRAGAFTTTGAFPPKQQKKLGPPITRQQAIDAGLSLYEAMYYEKLGRGRVRCNLCPNRCDLEDGERGPCKVRVNFEGTLYTLVFGRPVALNNDPIEKKPLFHVLPGTAAFSMSTVGCNLGCIFCQNWTTSQITPEEGTHRMLIEAAHSQFPGIITSKEEVTPAQIVALAARCRAKSIAYTYTEASIYYEYMLETAKIARAKGLKNLWITCGFINPEPLRELCKYIDAANVDLKGFSEEFYLSYCKAPLAPVLQTLKTLRDEGVFFEITNLVIPGANDDPEMVRKMCKWIVKDLGPDRPLHFSRFYPRYRLTDRPPTPLETLMRCAEIAREEGLHYVYIGNVAESSEEPDWENTFCPACKRLLIRRRGFRVAENHIKDARCPYCGHNIPGIFAK